MKKLIAILLCVSSPLVLKAQSNSLGYDFFSPNSKSVKLSDNTPEGYKMTIYLDLMKDLKKSNMEFVMEKVDEALDLFTDSLKDATKTHVLEVAISPGQKHTFYRYRSYPSESVDVAIIDNEVINIKHHADTIRVYEHHETVQSEDTFSYKIVYEILAKDITYEKKSELTHSVYNHTQAYLKKRRPLINVMNVVSRLGVYWGVGITSSFDFPAGFHNDMGFFYTTSRAYNDYTPFVGYNLKFSLTYTDNMYRGVEFHMLEFGMMRSTSALYHVLTNKYSMEVGIMRSGSQPNWDNGLTGEKYMLGLGINFPVINNFGIGIDVGNNFSRSNPRTYAGISFKGYLSGKGF